jgi:hypothetical protein
MDQFNIKRIMEPGKKNHPNEKDNEVKIPAN